MSYYKNKMENPILQHQSHRITHSMSYVVESVQKKQERESTTLNKKMFLEFFEKSRGIISVACQKIDICRATYYVWMKNDPKFRKAVEEIIKRRPEVLEERM